MAKRSRKKQGERKDFQKVKFKVGKKKPKGLNVTDTAFKSRSVNIVEQFQTSKDATKSSRGVGIKKICSLLSHHAVSQRTFALSELSDYIDHHPDTISFHIADLLNAILPRLLDEEYRISSRVRYVLDKLFRNLGEGSRNILEPFTSLIINYAICALTHVNGITASNALNIVDLLPMYLDVKCGGEDGAKLLGALMSMVSTYSENRKRKRVTHLHSVGHFANEQARLLVMVRAMFILEALCEAEEEQKLRQNENVVWSVMEPTTFMLRNPLAVDLTPRAISWHNKSNRTSLEGGVSYQTPQDNLIAIFIRALSLVTAYWPTGGDKPDEGHLSFYDLAARRCCQDIFKVICEKLDEWSSSEGLDEIDDISVCLMEAAQAIINENPLTLGKYSTKYDRHEFRHLQRFISRVLPGETDLRDGRTVVHHLNRNAGDLIRCYTRFGRNTGASVELINKLGFEEKKIDRYCEEYEKQKTDHRSEAKRRREQENFEATASEKLDSVEMAGVHHDHSYGSEVSVAVS